MKCYSLFFLLTTNCIALCNRDPQITFGELREVHVNGTLERVYDVEPDLLNPGGLLISDRHRIGTISAEGELEYIAGEHSYYK